jgi:hypothetical protein
MTDPEKGVYSMLKPTYKQKKQYDTWYSFKKEMELYLCCHIENVLWLKIKPKKALPWNEIDMRRSISAMFKN